MLTAAPRLPAGSGETSVVAALDPRRALVVSALLVVVAGLVAAFVAQTPDRFDCGDLPPAGHDDQVAQFHVAAAVTLPLAFAALLVAVAVAEGRPRSVLPAAVAGVVVSCLAVLPLVSLFFLIGALVGLETSLALALVPFAFAPVVAAASGRERAAVWWTRAAIWLALLAVLPSAVAYAVWYDGGPLLC
jgi:hypothetical protein